MDKKKFDIIIIGSGPGGEGAAMQAVKGQKNVLLVERFPLLGGACTHKGTIPSKALRYSLYLATSIKGKAYFQGVQNLSEVKYQDYLADAAAVIHSQVKMRTSFYERNHVEVIHGFARFQDPHTIVMEQSDGSQITCHGDAIVIATGSRPYHPSDVDFSHPRICDSDTILELKQTPRSISIYGAGVIGCEYASIFRNMGIKVNLVNTRPRLLEFLDDEITDALSYHFRDEGVLLRHNETYEKVEAVEDGVVLHLQSGKKLKSDILLWANGRTGNTSGMGLEEIGIPVNQRSQLDVNDDYQTTIPHIYAVGDVIGYPSLASSAYDQGRFASRHILYQEHGRRSQHDFPTGIYTSPEISSLGKTEKELTDAKIPYEVGHAHFRNLARAQIIGVTVGVLKILFHRETLEILGIHCFGSQAAEIIHIGQAIMSQRGSGNNLNYFVDTTFNYPTMAEAYRVAALNGLNRVV